MSLTGIPCSPVHSGECSSYKSPGEGLDERGQFLTFASSLQNLVSLGPNSSGTLLWKLDQELRRQVPVNIFSSA